MKQITIINGPNLNLLGRRQPDIYGNKSFEEYFEELQNAYPTTSLHYYQSNHEGDLIDLLHDVGFRHDGIIINPGGYTHSSIALMDAVTAIDTPVVEVHLTNIYEREEYRHVNFIAKVVKKSFVGFGLDGYNQAISFLINYDL